MLFFFFHFYIYTETYGYFLSNVTRITLFRPLQLKLCIKYQLEVKFVNIRHGLKHCLNFISNLLLFEYYIQKYLQNIKQILSRYFIYKICAKY